MRFWKRIDGQRIRDWRDASIFQSATTTLTLLSFQKLKEEKNLATHSPGDHDPHQMSQSTFRSDIFCPQDGNPREQINGITAFIDGSNVYGSDVSTARRLRLGRRGRLRVTRLESEDLLPLAPEEFADHSKRQYCFAAGNKEPLSCPDKLFSIQSSDLTRCLFRSKAFTRSESWKKA